jgi:hypothetical protein
MQLLLAFYEMTSRSDMPANEAADRRGELFADGHLKQAPGGMANLCIGRMLCATASWRRRAIPLLETLAPDKFPITSSSTWTSA